MSQSRENRDSGGTRLLISIVVVPVLVLDAMLRPLYGPLVRAVARFRLLAAITAQIIRLPPYGILCVLAVPFIIAEPLKVIALYWMGGGHFMRGAATMAFAYGLSFVLVERIYDAGREKLMQIGWLHRLMRWVASYRDAFMGWLRATRAWQRAQSALALTRVRLRRMLCHAKSGPD